MSSFAEGLLQDLALDKFNETAQDKIRQNDPYSLPAPPGLSKRDSDILRRCKRRAHQLDHNAVLCYCCPCFFGLNTAICLIPIIGPIWANSLSGRVIKMAEEADIPATLTAQMTANITLDFLITLPPFIGALFEWMHRCNTRNITLLDTYLRQRAKDNLTKATPSQTDTVTQLEPSQEIEMRFTDVSVQAQPIPGSPQRAAAQQGQRGIGVGKSKGTGKVPKRGRSGEQEMGVM